MTVGWPFALMGSNDCHGQRSADTSLGIELGRTLPSYG
jgi:hypothetical protein